VQIVEEVKEKRPTCARRLTFAVDKDGPRGRVPADSTGGARASCRRCLCLHQTNGNLGKGFASGFGWVRRTCTMPCTLTERGYVHAVPGLSLASASIAAIFGNPVLRAAASIRQSGTTCAGPRPCCKSLPEVDGERIGCIGHSLGGHNTMFTAAIRSTHIKALVSNCGFTSFPKYYGRQTSRAGPRRPLHAADRQPL